MTEIELVEKFQCPGCVCGGNTQCGAYKPSTEEGGIMCRGHVLGTSVMLGNGMWNIALGLPQGFHRPGVDWFTEPRESHNKMMLRLWANGERPEWDKFNVAVWALEQDGFLFVRTYAPRINKTWTDVIEGGTLNICPGAINVGEFIDEID